MNTKFKKFAPALSIALSILFLFNCASRNALKISPSEAEYLKFVVGICENYRDVVGQIVDPLSKVEENYSLLMDKNLKLKVTIYLKAIQSNGENFRNITNIPTRCLGIHGDLQKVNQYLDNFAELMVQAFDGTDVSKFKQAVSNLLSVVDPLGSATKKIKELKK